MRIKTSPLRALLLSFITLTAAPLASPAAAQLMPLRKGCSWTYEGRVEWEREGAVVEKKRVRLTTQIAEVFNYPKARVAVVVGFPPELAWYGDNPHPSYSLLILTRANLYHRRADNKEAAYRMAREFAADSKGQSQFADSILSYPPRRCKISRLHVKGFGGRRRCERSVYRTNPDIEIIDFVRGLGVVRYYYKHFGTVSLADVKLKEVRFPKMKR